MIIVIDAYNVLKLEQEQVGESERRAFIADLRTYGRKKSHKMVVVFDGGPYQWPFSCVEKGVLVIYSGVNDTADDCIKKYIKDTSVGQAVLVSSDYQLCLWASDHGIPSVGSSDFLTILRTVLKHARHVDKKEHATLVKTGSSSEEIDDLMKETSDMRYHKAKDCEAIAKVTPQKKVKKKDRNALHILKKLQ